MASLCCSILQLTHVEYFDRSVEALEDEFAYCFQLRKRFDLGVHFCIDQNLAIERLIAEAGGEICDRSGHGILETSLVANAPECRIAVGDTYTEAKIMAVSHPLGGYLCDSVAHLKRPIARSTAGPRVSATIAPFLLAALVWPRLPYPLNPGRPYPRVFLALGMRQLRIDRCCERRLL